MVINRGVIDLGLFKQVKFDTLVIAEVLAMAYNYSLLSDAHDMSPEVFPNPDKLVDTYLEQD